MKYEVDFIINLISIAMDNKIQYTYPENVLDLVVSLNSRRKELSQEQVAYLHKVVTEIGLLHGLD